MSTLTNGLIDWWDMIEPEGPKSSATGTHTLLEGTGGANKSLTAPGLHGNAFSAQKQIITGNPLYVPSGSKTTLEFAGSDFSFVIACNPSQDQQSTFCSLIDNVVGSTGYQLYYHKTNQNFTFAHNTRFNSSTFTTIGDMWLLIIITYTDSTGVNTITIYDVTGNVEPTKSSSGALVQLTNAAAENFVIGAGSISGGTTFHGLVDFVGVWNRVLTAQEHIELFNNGDFLTYAGSLGNNNRDSMWTDPQQKWAKVLRRSLK